MVRRALVPVAGGERPQSVDWVRQIAVVSVDPHEGYRSATTNFELLDDETIVVDPFHIVRLANAAVTKSPHPGHRWIKAKAPSAQSSPRSDLVDQPHRFRSWRPPERVHRTTPELRVDLARR